MAEIIARRPARAPTHPGAILRDDVLPALDITITAAAEHLRITRQQLHRILAEQSGISHEMAFRLGKLCGNGENIWLALQDGYDRWHALQRLGSELEKIPTLEAVRELI